MAAAKVFQWISGKVQRVAAVIVSAGAADEGKIPGLNANGVLDDSVINASATGGAGCENKTAKYDANGRLSLAAMPTGIGPSTSVITATEALSAGDFVNIYNNGGTPAVRKADAATGKLADGFIKAAYASGTAAVVYTDGVNDAVTGLTAGTLWLSNTQPGKAMSSPPATDGHYVQEIGVATSATSMDFNRASFSFQL